MNTSRITPNGPEARYQPFEVVTIMDRRETVRVSTNGLRYRSYAQHNGFAETPQKVAMPGTSTTGQQVFMGNTRTESEPADTVNVASTPSAVPDSVVGTIGLVDRQEQIQHQDRLTDQQAHVESIMRSIESIHEEA